MKNINLRIFSIFLLIIFYTTSISCRPQLPPEIVADDPNYPEGSWRPVSLMTREEKPSTKPTIDQNNSRVRIEHGGQTTEFRKARRDVSTSLPEAENKNSTKRKTHPIIGDSIKRLATQLLDAKDSEDVKNKKENKLKEEIVETSLKKESRVEEMEMSHAGVALPMSLEDVEKELLAATTITPLDDKKNDDGEGISTWVLLSGAPTTQKSVKVENTPQKIGGNKADKQENLTNESEKQTTTLPRKIVKVTTPRTIVDKTTRPKYNGGVNSKTSPTTKQPSVDNNEKSNSANTPTQKNNNKSQQLLTRVKASALNNNQTSKNVEVPTTKSSDVNEEINKEITTSIEKVEAQEELPSKQKYSMKQEISVKQESSIKPEKPVENTVESTKEKSSETSIEDKSSELEVSTKTSEIIDSSVETEALETPSETTTEYYEPLESKSIEIDFPESRNEVITSTTKKPKRPPTIKRKKNKIRTKRPGTNKTEEIAEKTVNGTKTKPAVKTPAKPISTQIMNYLSREVMPTVGVGLVTLVAAAGVASYFLYPFGALRRSYEVDRQDTDLYNYNSEEYAGQDGQSEEEMFGKVIAGMPASNFYTKPYQPTYRYQPKKQQIRYRNVNPQSSSIYSSNYNMYHQPNRNYNVQERFAAYKPDIKSENPFKSSISASNADTIETVVQKQTGYTVSPLAESELSHRSQFVVGNVPKELIVSEAPEVIITAATVPEHGPRRKRDVGVAGDAENEIDNEIIPGNKLGVEIVTTTEVLTESTPASKDKSKVEENTVNDTSKLEPELEATTPETLEEETSTTKPMSLVDIVKRIINFKVRVGLSLLRSTSDAFSRYIDKVEERVKEAKIFD